MKKSIFMFCISLFLISCGGIESDAQKLANIDCEIKKMTNPNPNKILGLANEFDKLKKEFKDKYKDNYQEFDKVYRKALGNCK
jgi:hypothetical protein